MHAPTRRDLYLRLFHIRAHAVLSLVVTGYSISTTGKDLAYHEFGKKTLNLLCIVSQGLVRGGRDHHLRLRSWLASSMSDSFVRSSDKCFSAVSARAWTARNRRTDKQKFSAVRHNRRRGLLCAGASIPKRVTLSEGSALVCTRERDKPMVYQKCKLDKAAISYEGNALVVHQ